jgi:hypothetical protein
MKTGSLFPTAVESSIRNDEVVRISGGALKSRPTDWNLDATNITFGASNMQHIDSYCFANSGLTTLKIPNCLMALGPGSFHSRRFLEKVTFEQGCHLKEIPEFCFACCGFEFIAIPNSIKTLGKLSFFF